MRKIRTSFKPTKNPQIVSFNGYVWWDVKGCFKEILEQVYGSFYEEKGAPK